MCCFHPLVTLLHAQIQSEAGSGFKQFVHPNIKALYQVPSASDLHCIFTGNCTGARANIFQIKKILTVYLCFYKNKIWFYTQQKNSAQSAPVSCHFLFVLPSCLKPHASLPSSLPCPLFSPALPVVHSSGWEWTSQLAPLKKTHISVCSPFASVIFPSVETWPLSVHWLNISLSLSLSVCIPAWLCCRCYHAAMQVRKGLTAYSSHYWLLNLVMVVKALPVPLCLRGQLMACFMSSQSCASLLGHLFHSHPTPFHTPSPRRVGLDRQATDRHLFVPVWWVNLSHQKSLRSPSLLFRGWEAFCNL